MSPHSLTFPVQHLYVHVPFCAHKCEYCAFYSEATNGPLINRYVDALCDELRMVADHVKPKTVFFGGGTPSILNRKQLEAILGTMDRLGLGGATEWTVECNPATVSPDKARLLRDHGVNRISMGVQTMNEDLLDRLGRIHSRRMVFESYDTLRAAGFSNINLDLMFAIPTQSLEIWEATLNEILDLQSEHLSCYEVIYEEDTPLYHQLQAGEFDVDEDLACEMYDRLVDWVSAAGFRQYEVANFARPGEAAEEDDPEFACRHNINYWRGGEYFGLGPSADEFVNGVRTKNWSNTGLYCEQIERGQRAINTTDRLDPVARAGETAAFGLRMNRGWRFDEFKQRTGRDLRVDWTREMDELSAVGWGRRSDTSFRLTREGLRFADAAAERFLRV